MFYMLSAYETIYYDYWWDEAFVGEGSRTLGLIMRQLPHAMDQQFFDAATKMKQKGSTNLRYKF